MRNERATLIRLRAADGGARLLLTLLVEGAEGPREETLSLFSARLPCVPQPGEIDAGTLAFYRAEAEICRAVSAALRALSYGGCSRRTLIFKLRQKGISAEAAEAGVAELETKGYLKETEGALREAERGMEKLWGDKRILLALRAKGYGDIALEAVAERLSEENAAERCARLAVRRRLYPLKEEDAQAVFAVLSRYGYSRTEMTRAFSLLRKKHMDNTP